jgi:hypothetical protein
MTSNLPRESYIKYSNCLPEQYNDFNYWKPRVPYLEEITDLEEPELATPLIDKEMRHDKMEMPTPVERAAIFAHNLKSEVS